MVKELKIIFVRHGESEKNVLHIKTCEINKYPLTDRGKADVEKMAEKLTEMKIDFIVSSPVLRARETAEIINKKIGADFDINDLATEYQYGEWDGRSKTELLADKRSGYREYKNLDINGRFKYKLGKTGESRKEVVERCRMLLDKLVDKYLGKTVLLVSHGGINGAIYKALTDCSLEEFFNKEAIGFNVIEVIILDESGNLKDFKSVNLSI